MSYPTRVLLGSGLAGEQVMTVAVGIAVFVLLMLLMWFVMRWLSRKGFGGGRSKHMEVLDRLVISRDSCILLLRVADRVFAVSAGKDSSSLICELSASELGLNDGVPPGGASAGSERPKAGAGFWKRFSHNMKLNMGLLPKGTKPMTPGGGEPDPRETAGAFKDVLEKIQQAQAETRSPSHPPETGREESGQSYVQAGEQTDQVQDRVTDYDAIIENMRNLGLVDKDRMEGRRARTPSTSAREKPVSRPEPDAEQAVKPAAGQVLMQTSSEAFKAYERAAGQKPELEKEGPSAPVPVAPIPAAEPDKYDMMFDLIAKRQAKYAGKKDRGKEAP